MDRFENFLKRDYRYNRCDHTMTVFPTHHWRGNGQGHFLSRSNNLWPAYNYAATTHFRQDFTDPLINLPTLNDVWLKRPVKLSAYRPDCQRNQVRVLFQSLLQS